jgi:YidC/Oxa1 family membrane protein insertase
MSKIHGNIPSIEAAIPELVGKLKNINFDLFKGFSLAVIPSLPWSKDPVTGATVGLSFLLIIPVLSCATAYLQMILSQKFNGTQNQTQGNMKVMMYTMPLVSLWIGFSTPAAMGVYWTVNNLLSIAQEYYLTNFYMKKMEAEDKAKADLIARRQKAEEQFKEEERLRRLEAGDDGTKNMSKKKKYRLKNSQQPVNLDKPKTQSDNRGEE